MKKLILVVAVILGITASSKGQQLIYNASQHSVGDSVEQMDDTRQYLSMTIEHMKFENVRAYKVIDVFKLQRHAEDGNKLVASLVGTKMKFQVTDDKWNYLDMVIYVDLDANFFASGKYNGRAFTRNIKNGELYYDDNDEMVENFDWEIN
jgi:hypothetical protein